MTIAGVSVAAARDHAVVWADTLVTSGRRPDGHGSKVCVNPLAGVLGVGAGMERIVQEASLALLAHAELAEIVPAVAAALRAAALRQVGRPGRREPGWFSRNGYALAGWSVVERQVLAFEFAPDDLFEPALTRLCAWPDVALPADEPPLSADLVRDVAARQAQLHRAGGGQVGRLSIATITRHGIVVLPPCDLPDLNDALAAAAAGQDHHPQSACTCPTRQVAHPITAAVA